MMIITLKLQYFIILPSDIKMSDISSIQDHLSSKHTSTKSIVVTAQFFEPAAVKIQKDSLILQTIKENVVASTLFID